MTSLIDWAAPDGTEALIQWLKVLGDVRRNRPPGGALPFRTVKRIGGPSDRLTDQGLYAVSTFAADTETCQAEAQRTHRRILLIAGNFTEQAHITLADGSVVQADDVRVMEAPIEVNYGDDTPYSRYVGTYHVDLRIVSAI